jgi:hypothetical protein
MIGLFPYLVFKYLHLEEFSKDKIFKTITNNLTFQNVIGGLSILVVGIGFLSSNVGHHQSGFIWDIQYDLGSTMIIYFVFCFFEFLLLSLSLIQLTRKKEILWILAILMLLPLYRYGHYYDFAMRASIPLLLVLFLHIINYLTNETFSDLRRKFIKIIIVFLLLIGSITPIIEFNRSLNSHTINADLPKLSDDWVSFDYGGDEEKIQTAPNFVVGKSNQSFFFKYLGK